MTVFDLAAAEVKEVQPGHAVVIKRRGTISEQPSPPPLQAASCSFERIYFSRGNDVDIYRERQALGGRLADQVHQGDRPRLGRTRSSASSPTRPRSPTTGSCPPCGRRAGRGQGGDPEGEPRGRLTEALLDELILRNWPRGEKVVSKDIKIRTFIGQESMRNQLASHVYDITYGSVRAGVDNLVCVDDSIVRGTTLRRSILRILARLNPRKIVIVSTAPQIRYPDCYGIDMSEIGNSSRSRRSSTSSRRAGARSCSATSTGLPRGGRQGRGTPVNHVRKLYEPFTAEEISARISSSCGRRGSSGRARSRSSSRRSRTCTRPCPTTRATGTSPAATRLRAATGS
jgi:amidophosphoribosyltransferase